MGKTADIAKVSAKGSFHVLWGLVISTVISSVGTIFIARLLGADLYGVYTVVLTVPSIIQIFRDWGMNYAVVKFTAQYRAEGRIDEIRSVYLTGILFEVIAGLVLSIFSLFFANYIATDVFNRASIAPLIQIVSFSIFAGGLVSAATAAFTGYERLELNSIMLICQSISKTAIIVTLVILGLGTAGATIGYTAGVFIAGSIGIALIGVIYKRLPAPSSHRIQIKAYLTAMLSYCLPLSFVSIITLFLQQFYAFLLPIHYATDNIPIGNYGVALNFVTLITFFSTPITTLMLPTFSKIDSNKDPTSIRNIFRFSVKYGSLFVIPVTVLVMSLADPAVNTLFGDTYNTAGLYLALFAIQYLYSAVGYFSLAGLLNGQGQTGFSLKMAILTGLFGFPLGYVLIINYGVLGLITATLVSGVPTLIWELSFIKHAYNAVVDWGSSLRILLSSGTAGILTYLFVSEIMFTSWIKLLLGIAVFILVLVPLLILSQAVTRSDIANLKLMVGELGILGVAINKVLSLLEKISTLFGL